MELVSTFSVWKTDMNIWMTDDGSGGFIFILPFMFELLSLDENLGMWTLNDSIEM